VVKFCPGALGENKTLLPQHGLGGIDDADRWIFAAVGAELLGVLDEHVGVEDRLVGIALVPAVQSNQHHLDRVVTAFDELLASHRGKVEHNGVCRADARVKPIIAVTSDFFIFEAPEKS
jgi:hypothetical protein